jgi:hypothetical protein
MEHIKAKNAVAVWREAVLRLFFVLKLLNKTTISA